MPTSPSKIPAIRRRRVFKKTPPITFKQKYQEARAAIADKQIESDVKYSVAADAIRKRSRPSKGIIENNYPVVDHTNYHKASISWETGDDAAGDLEMHYGLRTLHDNQLSQHLDLTHVHWQLHAAGQGVDMSLEKRDVDARMMGQVRAQTWNL